MIRMVFINIFFRLAGLLPPRFWLQIQRTVRSLIFRRHRSRLIQRLGPFDGRYRRYLDSQLRRTLIKDDGCIPLRARQFIDLVIPHLPSQKSRVLCVGCRNDAEIYQFRKRGVQNITGIDLFSRSEDVRIMDMHDMEFKDASFDAVFSSHSFEHALCPERVAEEFARVAGKGGIVAVEVPVAYRTGEADLFDFESPAHLLSLFGDHVGRVLYRGCVEHQYPNFIQKAIRVIFTVDS